MLPSGSSGRPSQSSSAHSSAQILARIAVLRPVLPRPAQQDMGSPFPGPAHNLSMSAPHGHPSNRHHDSYAPYTRHGMTPQNLAHPQSYVGSSGPSNPAFSYTEQTYHRDPMQMGNLPHPSGGPAWPQQLPQRQQGNNVLDSFPSMCSCGDDCACPGCVHHSRSLPSSSAYASCRNPDHCGTCLDCTIMSLPASAIFPPDTALSIYNDSPPNDAIDDWLRHMSASKSNSSDFQHGFPVHNENGVGGSFQGWNGPSSNRAFPPYSNNNSMNRDPRGMPNYNFGSNTMIPPFPTQPQHRSSGSMSSNRSQQHVIDPRLLATNSSMGGGGSNGTAFPNVPRSRSPSSSSSQSSYYGSDTHSSSIGGRNGGFGGGRPSGRMQGMFPNPHGGRSTPQLDIRPNMMRGPSSSSSISPSPGSGSGSCSGPTSARSPFPSSNPDSEYDPSLAGLQIY